MFSVIWKYKIKPVNREAFEFEYGAVGSWCKLFGKSADYKGSFLHKSADGENTYFLIDTWITKDSYELFKKMYADIYTKLSSQFEYLYITEEKIGAFNSVNS